MKVRNSGRWAPRGPKRWAIALVALLSAAFIRTLLHPVLGAVMPGTAFLIAAVLVQYYGGLGPACCVMFAGLCIADYLFVPPYGHIEVIDQSDIKLLVSYLLVTIVLITLVERLRRAQYRAELLGAVSQSRYEMLLRHDNERLISRRATDEMHRMLHHIVQYTRSLILIKGLDVASGALPASVMAEAAGDNDEPFRAGIAYGVKHAQVHPDDLTRASDQLLPGHHRMRFLSGSNEWRAVECVCEQFFTPSGAFLVLRTED